MIWILSIALVLVVALILLRIAKGAGGFGLSMNVLLAKHAWDNLGSAAQDQVRLKAQEILARASGPTWELLESPPQAPWKYSVLALAMLEMDMPPALPGEKWVAVEKPFNIRADDPRLSLAQKRIERVHGVRVTLGTPFI